MTTLNSSSQTVADAATGFASSATFLAVAAAIGAGDVMTGAKEFSGIGPVAGGEVTIELSEMQIDAAALVASEAGYTLHFYNVTPPSALADNVAWDLPAGDRASYLGSIALGTPVDLGASLRVEVKGIGKQITVPAGGSLFAYLETDAGFTALADTRTVTIHSKRV